jgi:hypothetical protein
MPTVADAQLAVGTMARTISDAENTGLAGNKAQTNLWRHVQHADLVLTSISLKPVPSLRQK